MSGSQNLSDLLDIFPFAEFVLHNSSEHSIEIWFSEPRDISVLHIRIIAGVSLQKECLKSVEYWRSTWPSNRPDPNVVRGSGRSGWQAQDDWFRGIWQRADIEVLLKDSQIEVRFNDLAITELPKENYSTKIRRTLKIKILFTNTIDLENDIDSISILTPSVLSHHQLSIITSLKNPYFSSNIDIRLFNGYFSDRSINKQIETNSTFEILGCFASHSEDFDRTNLMLFDSNHNPLFSVGLEDIKRDGFVAVLDYGVVIIDASNPKIRDLDYETNISHLKGKTVLQRVKDLPERCLDDALLEFRGKRIFYAPIGLEGVRAKGAITPEGFFSVASQFIRKVQGPDSKRLYWNSEYSQLQFYWGVDSEFDFSKEIPICMRKPEFRGYCDNLPIFETRWAIQPHLEIQQIGFATSSEINTPTIMPRGDLIPIGMFRYIIHNRDEKEHRLFLSIKIGALSSLFPDSIILDSIFDEVFHKKAENQSDRYELSWNRLDQIKNIQNEYKVMVKGIGLNFESKESGLITISFVVGAKSESIIDFALPFLSISDSSNFLTLDFETERQKIISYWKQRLSDSSKIEVPDKELTLFYEKQLWHVLLTNDREIGADNVIGRVGTMGYGCYANEVCMITMDLDRRGRFEDARRILDTFVKYQSTAGLDGDYEDLEGIYFGAGGYEMGNGYNQNQGFVMWAITEHTLMSKDFEWFKSIIPSVLKACAWIESEIAQYSEKITQIEHKCWKKTKNGEFLGKGLMPPGRVEDITDYWFWLSTNAYTYYGLAQIATILEYINHEQASNIRNQALALRDSIIKSFTAARVRNPVVKLRNGEYVPHTPCHVHRRGRGFGWIQEVLEGSIHLIRTDLISPNSKEARWIVEDLEDNCYLSAEFGYPLIAEDFVHYWYRRGGFSMQPFLLCNHYVYLLMGEKKPFLRAMFNSFAVNYREDTKLFTEHPLPTMFDWFGHSFKTSDEAQCTSTLRFMFAMELCSQKEVEIQKMESNYSNKRPDTLLLLSGIPDNWYRTKNGFSCKKLPIFFGIINEIDYRNKILTISIETSQHPLGIQLKNIIVILPANGFIIKSIESTSKNYEIINNQLHIDLKNELEKDSIKIALTLSEQS
jgi:hypothetical protein